MADRSRDALDRYWDDLVRGHPSTPDSLDPRLTDAVLGLHAARDVDGPSPTFVARLKEDLMPPDASTLSPPFQPTMVLVPNRQVTSTPSRTVSPARTRTGWSPPVPAWLPRAAVVALALVAGLIALDPGLRRPDRGEVIPAAVFQDATPSPSADAPPPLTSLVLPSDVVEDWDAVSIGVGLYTIPAGSESAWESDYRSCCPGARLFTVLSGTVTVAVDGEAQVIVPGAEPQSLPAGSLVELSVGYTIVTRYEDANRWSNTGAEPARVLNAGMVTGSPPGPDINPGWAVDGGDIKGELALPQGPYALTTVLRELAWDETIPPPAEGAHYLVMAAPGTDGFVSRGPDGSVNAHGAEGTTMTVYLTLVAPAAEGNASTTSVIGADETLTGIVMPGDIIPSGDRTDLALALYTVSSGTTTRPAGTAFNGCCPGLDVAFVLAGTAIVRGDGPMQLTPGGVGIEPRFITVGTDVVIEPGDTLLFEEDVATNWTVVDGGSMSLLWGLVLGGAILDPPFGAPAWVAEDIHLRGTESFPIDPYTIPTRSDYGRRRWRRANRWNPSWGRSNSSSPTPLRTHGSVNSPGMSTRTSGPNRSNCSS